MVQVCGPMVFEYCRLVIDRPPYAGQRGLVYLAETIAPGASRIVAASPVFHPDIEPEAHAVARAAIVALLIADGWESVPNQAAVVVGERFKRPLAVADDKRPLLASSAL